MTYIASTIVGSFAAAAFACLLAPQVYWNYQRRSTEGMSPSMIALWVISGVLFVAYLHSVEANIALLVQWHAVNFICCMIAGQWYRYRNRRPPPKLFSGAASNTPAPLRLSTPRLSASVTPTTTEKVILKLPAADRARASTRAQALFRHSVSQQQSPAAVSVKSTASTASSPASAVGPDGQPVTPRLQSGSDGRGGAGSAPTPMVTVVDHALADPANAGRNSAYTMGGTLRPLPPIWYGLAFGGSWTIAYVIVFLGAWQIFEQCEGVSGADWLPWVGGSIIPAVGLVVGFIPQITLIIRVKSSEGFSKSLSTLDFIGGGLSIIALAIDHEIYYKQMIPYFAICGMQLFMLVLTTCIYPPLQIIDDLKSDTAIALAERAPAGAATTNKPGSVTGGPAVSFFDAAPPGGRKSVEEKASAATPAPQPAPAPADVVVTTAPPSPEPAPYTSGNNNNNSNNNEPLVPPEAASALLLSVESESIPLPHMEAQVNVEPDQVALTVV